MSVDADTGGRILLERTGPVLRILLSNPGRHNALTWRMYDEFDTALEQASADPSIRVVVIRGQGTAFAAGTDITQFASFTTGEQGLRYEQRVGAILGRLLGLDIPVIAAVDGPAVGAGLAIAACSDVVVATDASTFGVPIARTVGNCIPPAVLRRLQARMGPGRTMAMLLTASLVPAHEAQKAGFVHTVVPRDEFDDTLERLSTRMSRTAPITVAALKEMDRRLQEDPTAEADDLLLRCYGSEDFREGVAAFTEHRTPRWKGL
ncbi:enoyl-CoA hydratase [Arthrobacter sp. Soc17.1.1.1]|uniref:enoyl-CoA hydratase n=1 Tax=Arthrobacter sp. Soc17.1.1.1 TaxID=3121277 RepID=UPI002FE49F03